MARSGGELVQVERERGDYSAGGVCERTTGDVTKLPTGRVSDWIDTARRSAQGAKSWTNVGRMSRSARCLRNIKQRPGVFWVTPGCNLIGWFAASDKIYTSCCIGVSLLCHALLFYSFLVYK